MRSTLYRPSLFRESQRLVIVLAGLAVTSGCESSTPQTAKEPPIPTAPEVVAPKASTATAAGDFTTTPSGLKYRILREGTGPKPTKASTVKVHYRGWLDNGNVFDSSYKRNEPIEFPLGGVIPGWTEGMQLVGEGGEIELEIPSDLGYGPQGSPPDIPPNATLHFSVELLKVK